MLLVVIGIIVWFLARDVTSSDFSKIPGIRLIEKTAVTASREELSKTEISYTDSVVGFSFAYPSRYRITSFDDAGGRVVLVRNTSKDIVLQIFVTDRTDPKPLTLAEIKAVPGIKVGRNGTGVVGNEQVPSVVFESITDGLTSQEVWFVRDSLLYQVSTYSTDAPLLPILTSLIWE